MTSDARPTADQATLRELWEEFEAEIPAPPRARRDLGARSGRTSPPTSAAAARVWLAEDDEGVAGSVRATMLEANVWHIVLAYVRPRARQQGVLHALMREALAEGRGARLDPRHARRARRERARRSRPGGGSASSRARTRWRRRSTLAERLGERAPAVVGAAYVQTDDHDAVERAVAKYLPRIGRSASTDVAQPRNGWTRVDDELCSRDPKALRRLGRELSLAIGDDRAHARDRGGRGRPLHPLGPRRRSPTSTPSVPEHFGPLPPGDVVALGANPTVAQRLTGADPDARARGRAHRGRRSTSCRRAEELHAQLAEVLGVG